MRPAMRGACLIGGSVLAGAIVAVAWLGPGRHAETGRRLVELSIDGSKRRAIVFEPAGGRQGARLPLVLAFHGVGQSAEAMAESRGLASWAASGRAVVVFPEARRGMWTSVGVEADQFVDTADARFVAEILDRLTAEGRVDPDRVYLVGISNGATFAQMLGLSSPRRSAAVAAFAGGLPGGYTIPQADRSLPVLLLVGDRDEHGAEEGVRAAAGRLEAAGHDVTLRVLPGQGHRWDRRQNRPIWDFLGQHTLDTGTRSD